VKALYRRYAVIALAVGCAAVLGVGCAVGPNYKPPAQHMPATWVAPPTTQASTTVQEPLEVERWWTTFNDPELDSLVRRAVRANLDIQLASERIVQARAVLGVTEAGFFPTVDANGSYTRSFSAKGGGVVITSGAGGTGTITGGGSTTTVKPHAHDNWQAGLNAAWQLDIFGGIRRSIEAATATWESQIENRRDVLVRTLASVASDYITLRGFQQQIKIAQENLQSQIHNAEVTRKKVQGGTTTGLDVANADAQVASTRAQLAGFESLAQQEIYAISVLLGEEPAELVAELRPTGNIPLTPPVVPVGLPSELLRRRPDIRAAERQLASATAQIGVATADLFPKFSLTGTLTTSGPRYQSIGNWGTRFWSFGPSASWAIFDAGAIWSNIAVQNSLQRQALLTYRQTVLLALQDVEDSLTAYAQEQQRRAALADSVAANQRAVKLATEQYQAGVTDFLNVLVAEQSLYSSQNALVQSNQAVATDLVAIYRSLGGGWAIGEAPATQPAQ